MERYLPHLPQVHTGSKVRRELLLLRPHSWKYCYVYAPLCQYPIAYLLDFDNLTRVKLTGKKLTKARHEVRQIQLRAVFDHMLSYAVHGESALLVFITLFTRHMKNLIGAACALYCNCRHIGFPLDVPNHGKATLFLRVMLYLCDMPEGWDIYGRLHQHPFCTRFRVARDSNTEGSSVVMLKQRY